MCSKSKKYDILAVDVSNIGKQFRETCLPQDFSFKVPMMKYIWENPSSPKAYQKLIQCCKLFFLKNPILVFKTLEYNTWDGWTYCNVYECSGKYSCKQKHKRINLDRIKARIWVTKKFAVHFDHLGYRISNRASAFIRKIFQCDASIVQFSSQKLSYNALKFFSTGVKEFIFCYSVVKNDDGKEVALEDIIKLFAGAKKVKIDFASASYNAVCKSYDDFLNACQTIGEVELYCIPADFDVPKFYQHLKTSKSRAIISIHSRDNIPRLNEVIDEIKQTESFEFTPPVINHSGLGATELDELKKIQAREAAKYQ